MCKNRLKRSMCVLVLCVFCASAVFSQVTPQVISVPPPTFSNLFQDMNSDLTNLETITQNLNSNLQTVQTESVELKQSLQNAEQTQKQQERLYSALETDCNNLKAQSQRYQSLLLLEGGVIIGLSVSVVVLAAALLAGR